MLAVHPSPEPQRYRDFPNSASMEELGAQEEGETKLHSGLSCEETPGGKTPNSLGLVCRSGSQWLLYQSLEVLSHVVPAILEHCCEFKNKRT